MVRTYFTYLAAAWISGYRCAKVGSVPSSGAGCGRCAGLQADHFIERVGRSRARHRKDRHRSGMEGGRAGQGGGGGRRQPLEGGRGQVWPLENQ